MTIIVFMRISNLFILGAWLLYISANTVYAACDRSDVDYYLSKGFSQAQITALCGQAGGANSQSQKGYQAYDDKAQRLHEEQQVQKKKEEEIYFLQNALGAWDVKVNPRWLEYTRRICVATGMNPDITARTKVCPEVRYQVHFKDLDVEGYDREYVVFGARQLEVKGDIRRKLLHDFKEYPANTQRKLMAVYKSKIRPGATYIPIRRDVPILRVIAILREYARAQSDTS